MEVATRFRTVSAGIRYGVFGFVLLGLLSLLVSCGGGGGTTVVITKNGISDTLTYNATATVAADGTYNVSVLATDGGVAVVGETITFTVTTNRSGSIVSPTRVVTGANGRASAKYTAGSTAPATDIITFTSTNLTGTVTITVSKSSGDNPLQKPVVTADSDILVADGADQTFIKALVTFADGTKAANIDIRFTTTDGTMCDFPACGAFADPFVTQTGSDGIAWIILQSSTNLGQAKVTAQIVSNLSRGTVFVDFVPGDPATIVLQATPNNISADNASTSDITGLVTDANGHLVADGEDVFFSITTPGDSGSLSALSDTTVNGTVSVIYKSGTVTGPVVVRGQYSGAVFDDYTLNLIGESVGSIALSFDTFPLVANGISTTPVRAAVTNTGGNPVVDGTTVTFTTTGGTFPGVAPFTADTTGGIATIILTSGLVAGQYTVTATAGGVGQVGSMTFIPGPADISTSTLTAVPGSIPADGSSTSTITLVALDINGNPVADGTLVNFYTDAGSLPATGTTSNGITSVTLTSANSAAVATITAIVDGQTLTTTVNMGATGGGTGTASYIELDVSNSTISVKGSGGIESSVITATAYDETGSPIADCTDNIQFSIANGPGGGEELDGVPAPPASPVAKTTSSGAASVSLTSGVVSGTIQVKVEVVENFDCSIGGSYATAITTPIAIEAGEPATVFIFADNLVVDNGDGSISRTYSALVKDLHGNPVKNGTSVFFGLVDNPDPAGPPYLGYISAESDGATSASTTFTSALSTFVTDGLMDNEILIIREGQDEGGHRIASVDNETTLTLYNTLNGSETGLEFVAGSAEQGVVCGSSVTGNLEMDASCTPTTVGGPGSVKGVAHTTVTWPAAAIFKPFFLYAESVGGNVGDTLDDTYAAVAPGNYVLLLAPSTVLSGTTSIIFEATFKDGADNPIPDQPVIFSSENPLVAFIVGGNPVITDSNGKATAIIDTAPCQTGDVDVVISAHLFGFGGGLPLTVKGTAPTADFTSIDQGDSDNVIFVDNSTTVAGSTIDCWGWSFAGAGSDNFPPACPGGTPTPPTVSFGAAGTYSPIILTVENDLGCSDSETKGVTVP